MEKDRTLKGHEGLLLQERDVHKDKQIDGELSPSNKKQVENTQEDGKGKSRWCWAIPKRYILCFLVFWGFLLMNCERSCLSVAIVAMSSKRRVKEDGKWVTKAPEFHWDSKMKGIILSAFFYGYLVLQIPGGWLALRIGAKRVLGYAILVASAIHTCLPMLVRYNCTLFVVARVLQGLALGVALPTNHVIWSYWSPAHEKSCLISFTVAGLSGGMLVAMPISGFLSVYGFSGGWPSVFYFFGIIGMSWFFLWNFFVYETPETHPTITAEEKHIILATRPEKSSEGNRTDSVPWLAMVKSRPVWAIVVAHFAFDCSYYTLLVCMPLFLRDVHKFNIATTGVLAALPWLFMSIMTLIGGFLADFLRRYMKTVYVRKLLYVSGMVGSSSFIILAGFPERSEIAVAFMCIAVAFFGFSFTGFMVNPLDIAPKYAGIIIGFSNCISTSPGFIGPSLVGILTRDEKPSQWQLVFLGMGAISIFGIIVFTCLHQEKFSHGQVIMSN
ncbi:sialin-like [Rhopilema esculentum]|uniref:sialin-like n=1 Tax=Rhopilema esculentum TaxID=499914 RepID=UPI0031D7CF04